MSLDRLANIRKLPAVIFGHLQRLIVNRIGTGPDAYMITRDIIDSMSPKKLYQFVLEKGKPRFKLVKGCLADIPGKQRDIICPPHVKLLGDWSQKVEVHQSEANILGGMGLFHIHQDEAVTIPVVEASSEFLAFYGAHLVLLGNTIQLESEQELPLCDMAVGETYVTNYLTDAQLGGGEYIEFHDQPHLWIPESPDSRGHILLGKKMGDIYYFTGFSIPFGCAVYLSPHQLHSDAYLVGNYLVVYTVTEHYSTVLFRHKQQEALRFVNHN